MFVIEYALAQLWMSWGIQPAAMIGHSLGEYVAACVAGVFSLDDALTLIAARGRLMQDQPAGMMLAVRLPEAEVKSLVTDPLSIAAVNAATGCVVSGPNTARFSLSVHPATFKRRDAENSRRLLTVRSMNQQTHQMQSCKMDRLPRRRCEMNRQRRIHCQRVEDNAFHLMRANR